LKKKSGKEPRAERYKLGAIDKIQKTQKKGKKPVVKETGVPEGEGKSI